MHHNTTSQFLMLTTEPCLCLKNTTGRAGSRSVRRCRHQGRRRAGTQSPSLHRTSRTISTHTDSPRRGLDLGWMSVPVQAAPYLQKAGETIKTTAEDVAHKVRESLAYS